MKRSNLNFRKTATAILCLAVTAGFISCGKSVTSVELSESSLTLMAGKTARLSETVFPENAKDKSVTWTSSNPAVATVSDGLVSAKTEGETIITVTTNDGNKTATCRVTVINYSSSNTKLLTQKAWKLFQAISTPAYTNADGLTDVNLFNNWFYPCELNEVLHFKTDNTTTISQACYAGKETASPWYFLQNETQLNFRLYFIEEEGEPAYGNVDIITLDNDVFKFNYRWTDGVEIYTFTLTYRH